MTDEVGELLVESVVRDEWIDRNEHMNVAFYVLAFDLAIDVLWARLGMDDTYVETRVSSTFAVESHVAWLKEMPRNAPYRIRSQLLACDSKRIHHFQRMYHAEEGYLAATSEWMNLHIDLTSRRVSPWPPDVLTRIEAMFADQRAPHASLGFAPTMRVLKPLQSTSGYPASDRLDSHVRQQ
jgi:acyl-CoA thioester hydrolase